MEDHGPRKLAAIVGHNPSGLARNLADETEMNSDPGWCRAFIWSRLIL